MNHLYNSFREVLIFVAGSTPQIITETIYALACQSPPIYPQEIHIITTTHGKERIIQKLVNEGILAQLCQEYSIPAPAFSDSSVIVLKNATGEELDDIRSIEQNELAGNQIAAFLRQKAAMPGTRLHCSLAGGRKTMTFFMGLAFQLFARQWDKLYHVLVSPDFENNSNFYYKPIKNQQITYRQPDGKTITLDTDNAEITLAELPLIFLRDKLNLKSEGIMALVAEGQKEINTALLQQPLNINLHERTVYAGKTLIELKPVELAIYTAFLTLKHKHCRNLTSSSCGDCSACFVTLGEMASEPLITLIADNYQAIYNGDITKREELLAKWLGSLDPSTILRQQISKLNKTLKDELFDETLFPVYKIDCNRKYAGSRYGVRLEKGQMHLN